MPDPISPELDEGVLIFSMSQPNPSGFSAAQETSHPTSKMLTAGRFVEHPTIKPLFDGNRVGQAIPVLVEGEYHIKQPGGKYRSHKFDADQIHKLAAEQPRDVPFNYDHKRASGPDGVKGWLRFVDPSTGERLSFVKRIETPTGSKVALFAVPELCEEAVGFVERGIYRDTSTEYRLADGVLTGQALTSYPVMREVQFFSEIEPDQTKPSTGDVNMPDPAVDIKQTPEPVSNARELTAEEKKAIFTEGLAEFGLTADLLGSVGEIVRGAKEETKQAQLSVARSDAEKEADLMLSELGHFAVDQDTRGSIVAALEFSKTDAGVVSFGEAENQVDLVGVIKHLLGEIKARNTQLELVFGETRDVDGFEAETPEIAEEPVDAQVDPATVSTMKNRFMSRMGGQVRKK
jgi:hypothetical protein